MHKARMEAFSDGVLAILITIMVLELKVPHGQDWHALAPLAPVLFSYVLSFIFLAIYWNNHHHMLQASRHVDGRVLWANMHLLFWLSLVPAATAWMGDAHFAPWPVAIYGMILFFAGVAYSILCAALIRLHGRDSTLASALGSDWKAKASLALYFAAVLLALLQPMLSCGIYVLVALMWWVPDRRIEKTLSAG